MLSCVSHFTEIRSKKMSFVTEGIEELKPLLPRDHEDSCRIAKKRRIWIELAIVCLFIGWNMSSSIYNNQLLAQACKTVKRDSSYCDALGRGESIQVVEEELLEKVALILKVTTLLTNAVAGFVSLLMGSYSDNFGRRKMICFSFGGYLLMLTSLTFVSFLAEKNVVTSAWFYVIPFILHACSGGFPAFIIVTYCFVSDMTNDIDRSYRLAIIELSISLGNIIGKSLSGLAFEKMSATLVFLISSIIVMMTTVYVVNYTEETIETIPNKKPCEQIQEFFSLKPFKEMIQTAFNERAFDGRTIIWISVILIAVNHMNTEGAHEMLFLFVREKFNWNLKETTILDTVTLLLAILVSFLGLFVFKRIFKFSDFSIAMIATMSVLADSLLRIVTGNSYQIYLSSLLSRFKKLFLPMCRSTMATVVAKDERGKIFSFAGLVGILTTLIFSPFCAIIYDISLSSFPAAFYLITVIVCIVKLLLIGMAQTIGIQQ